MLALEVVLADAAGAPQPSAAPSHQRTFVFDEIDAGVGGVLRVRSVAGSHGWLVATRW